MRHKAPLRGVALLAAACLTVPLLSAPAAAAPTPDASAAGARSPVRSATGAHLRDVMARRLVLSVRRGSEGTAAAVAAAAAVAPTATIEPLGHGTFSVELPSASDVTSAQAVLRADPSIGPVSRDLVVRVAAMPDAPSDPVWTSGGLLLPQGQRTYLGARSAGYTYSANISPAWARAVGTGADRLPAGRRGVKIGVIDTGYTFDAPTFETTGAVVAGWDYADDDPDPTDPNGHGTWVANVIRAQTDNASQISGALGTLPATVVVYKVFSDATPDSGSLSAIVSAIYAAADAGCKVINLSNGLDPTGGTPADVAALKALLEQPLAYATAKGAVVVCAAGNSSGPIWYPAACANAFAVGSIDPLATGSLPRSSFSCRGPELDVCAPGETIAMVGASGATELNDGTSFAAPIVTSAAAMLYDLLPAATPDRVTGSLTATALHLGSGAAGSRNDDYGYGLVNADAAWNRLATKADFGYTAQSQPPLGASQPDPGKRLVHLSWGATAGTNVTYRYGWLGGPTRTTTALSADVVLPRDGPYSFTVEAVADDHLSGNAPSSAALTVGSSTAPLGASRIEGADRYETAVMTSRSSFPSGTASIVVASGENWPDALTAAPLARKVGAPLLLTHAGTLPYVVRDEVRRLVAGGGPVTVYIVGGTNSVSAAVQSRIEFAATGNSVSVVRLQGADRYATAAAVAARLASSETTCVLASGDNWPDALAAGPLAASAGWPILLVHAGSVPAATTAAVADYGIQTALVAGGASAVSTATADKAIPGGPAALTRLAGSDRFDTSRRLADWGYEHGILTGRTLGMATGASFPDGLAAGPALAAIGSPVIEVSGSGGQLDPLTLWSAARGARYDAVSVFGGTGVVPLSLEHAAELALRQP